MVCFHERSKGTARNSVFPWISDFCKTYCSNNILFSSAAEGAGKRRSNQLITAILRKGRWSHQNFWKKRKAVTLPFPFCESFSVSALLFSRGRKKKHKYIFRYQKGTLILGKVKKRPKEEPSYISKIYLSITLPGTLHRFVKLHLRTVPAAEIRLTSLSIIMTETEASNHTCWWYRAGASGMRETAYNSQHFE